MPKYNYWSKRNPLAIIYSALVFGSISCPFYYIALMALRGFFVNKFIFIFIFVFALLISTGFLFSIFILESNFERFLKHQWGKYFQPIFVAFTLLSFFITYSILGIVANFTLLTYLEYKFYLLVFLGIASTVALVLILLTPVSRLENFMNFKLSKTNQFYMLYRIFASILLVAILIFVSDIFYKYYLSIQPPDY